MPFDQTQMRWRLWLVMSTCLTHTVLSVTIVCVCIILFAGLVQPYQRGLYCDDLTIAKPFKPSTVGVSMLLAVTLITPFVCVKLVELILLRSRDQRRDFHAVDTRHLFKSVLTTSSQIYLEYLFGYMIVVALMHVGKSSFGVLRPHFLDVCRPNTSAWECSAGGSVYLAQVACTTTVDPLMLRVARESFPSGHAAVAVYSLLFLVVYFNVRKVPHFWLDLALRYCFLLIYAGFTLVCCVTRVTDHWHHLSDVIGGTFLGSSIAAVLFLRKDNAISKRIRGRSSVVP